MKKKQIIRLTENDLHRIIKESVKNVLNETSLYYDEDNFSGRHTLTDYESEEVPKNTMVFAYYVDNKNMTVECYGKMDLWKYQLSDREENRYGDGSCYWGYEYDEDRYNSQIQRLVRKGYKIQKIQQKYS